jgi:inorganic triphosphatase YgiF
MSEGSITSSAEVERKYDVDESQQLPELPDAIPSGRFALRATYFDTADFGLLSRRIVLRRREGGTDAGWHIKLERAGHRIEHHADLSDQPPAQLLDLIREEIAGEELSEIATLNTDRRTVHVLDSTGTPIAEIADDRVQATDVRAAITRTWREWEVELLPAAPSDPADAEALLDRIELHLLAAGAVRSNSPAKLARALGR